MVEESSEKVFVCPPLLTPETATPEQTLRLLLAEERIMTFVSCLDLVAEWGLAYAETARTADFDLPGGKSMKEAFRQKFYVCDRLFDHLVRNEHPDAQNQALNHRPTRRAE